MSITTKRPPIKQTVGAQFICFAVPTENGDWSGTFEETVEKTEVVKNIKISENSEQNDVYASGSVYKSDTTSGADQIEVEVVAFPIETMARMKGEEIIEGLHLAGGRREKPFFAYGKIVEYSGSVRLEWYPKCRWAGNTDEASTREEKFTEQNDTITINAYPFNENGDKKTYVDSSESTFPKGLTKEKFFTKPILTKEDLTAALAA